MPWVLCFLQNLKMEEIRKSEGCLPMEKAYSGGEILLTSATGEECKPRRNGWLSFAGLQRYTLFSALPFPTAIFTPKTRRLLHV